MNLPKTIVPWKRGEQVYIEDHHQYVIDCPLASGGCAHTYLAHHRVKRTEQVVIKTPNDLFWQTFGAEPCVNQFLKEGVTMATFKRSKNPHLVKFITTGLVQGVPTIVMEYVPGKNLYQRGANFTEAEALKYIHQVGSALTELHPDTVHRDVKHLNIIIREQTDEAVLLDFGIARSFLTLQQLPQYGGTPGFADPDNAPDARFDVYSLAVTLHWMITGHLPQELPSVDPSVISVTTQKAIRRATASATQRTSSIAAFLADLNAQIQEDLQGSSSPSPPDPSVQWAQGQATDPAVFPLPSGQSGGTQPALDRHPHTPPTVPAAGLRPVSLSPPDSEGNGNTQPVPTPSAFPASTLTILRQPVLLGSLLLSVIVVSFTVAFGVGKIFTRASPKDSEQTFLNLTGKSIGIRFQDDRWQFEPSDPQGSFGRDASILKLTALGTSGGNIKIEEFPATYAWNTKLDPYHDRMGFDVLHQDLITVSGHSACQIQYTDRGLNQKIDRLIIPTAEAVYVATYQAPVNRYDKTALNVLTTLTLPDAPYAQTLICP
ncbi:MAG: serine/threonine protein kinase [Prochlorotrichaceae cyanobacterium]|jgi:serine/threonine protein kinase